MDEQLKINQIDFMNDVPDSQKPVDELKSKSYAGWKKENGEKLLSLFRERMNVAIDFWAQQFANSLADTELLYDSSWTDKDRKAREDAGRPALDFNILTKYRNMVVGSIRNSRYGIHVHSSSAYDGVNVTNDSKKVKSSEIMEGLLRYVETRNNSHEVYSMAAGQAVDGGFGWVRVRTELSDSNPFEPNIIVENVPIRTDVYFDPYATKVDLSDAKWACIHTIMSKAEFDVRYPNNSMESATLGSYTGSGTQAFFEPNDGVKVCDYYWKQPVNRDIFKLVHVGGTDPEDKGTGEEIIINKNNGKIYLNELIKHGYKLVSTKKNHPTIDVMMVRCTHSQILEDPIIWPGMTIPIVPVWGRRVDYNGKIFAYSLVRQCHDIVRMVSYWMSAATERVQMTAKGHYIIEENQIGQHKTIWDGALTENFPYLPYQHKEGASPPRRDVTPGFASTEIQILGVCTSMMGDIIGIQEASLGKSGNEVSGLAIKRRQDAGANNVAEFEDNTRNMIQSVNKVVLEIIPKVYSNSRAQRIVMRDGTSKLVHINNIVEDEQTGKKIIFNKLDSNEYNCVITTGPGYQSQREEAFTMMSELIRHMPPEQASAVWDKLIALSDVPGSESMVTRLQKLVPYQLLTEEEKEANGLTNEPTPEQETQQMQIQADKQKSEDSVKVSANNLKMSEVHLQTAEQNASNKEGGGDGNNLKKAVSQEVKKEIAKLEFAKSQKNT